MARTTLRECEAYVARARAAGVRAGVPHAATWELDYAACYGGAAVGVNGGRGTLGDAMMSANRMAPAAFCQAMRILIDVLEDMARAGRLEYCQDKACPDYGSALIEGVCRSSHGEDGAA